MTLQSELSATTLALLADWMPTQRWFSGKDRPISGIEVLGRTVLLSPEAGLEHLVLSVEQGSSSTTYQVPLGRREHEPDRLHHVTLGRDELSLLHDGLHDRALTALLLQYIEETKLVSGEDGVTLTFHKEAGADLPLGEPSLVFTGEQSNTSLAYGQAAILKVFRRISPGVNPDIEIHDALTRSGCKFVAPLLGWIDGTWRDRDSGELVSGSLAMLQTLLVTATDGWRLALVSLQDLLAEGDLLAEEVGGDFASESARLGAATAEVHVAMANTLESDVRGQEGNAKVAAWMRERLESAVASVPALEPFAPALRGAYADLALLDEPTPIQRVHGDYHLGQVMRTSMSWKLLDFEGEPSKPLDERRALDSPIRDIAGMLRSYDYAARTLLVGEPPSEASAQRAYRADEWAERNRDAFCQGYAEAAGYDPRQHPVLLRAYEIDKAVYEAVYEAGNRPSWLPIPMAAIERLAAESVAAKPGVRKGPVT